MPVDSSWANKASVTGCDFTGAISATAVESPFFRLTDYGHPVEIGAYIDFHDIGSTKDYDARLSREVGDTTLRINGRPIVLEGAPAVYNLPLAEGCSGQATSIYYKTQEGMVFVNGCIGITSYTLGKVVATLPIGYRPTYDTATSGHAASVNGRASADIVIKATGSIEVWGENVPSYISFFAGFPAA